MLSMRKDFDPDIANSSSQAREMERDITRRDKVIRGPVKYTEEEDHGGCDNDCELDLLSNVHSDISSILHQIDELVMDATKLKKISTKGSNEVESFRSVLSDMLSSLKPWFPRLQEAISDCEKDQTLMSKSKEEELFDVESPEPNQFESLVSPSPLVAWRGGDHKSEKARQLFLLTPLPLGKSEFLKRQNASKLTSKKILPNPAVNQPLQASKEASDGVLVCESTKTAGLGNSLDCEPLASPVLRRKVESELLMTPCLKMSPPKSCTVIKPVLEASKPGKQGMELGANGSQSSGSSGENLCSKYPELLGIKHAPVTRKTDLEASPVWWFSPPKTCVLLEPVNEKKPIGDTGGSTISLPNIKPEAKHTQDESMSMVVESTPLMKEAESVMSKNRPRAGESTLKKELWTRFEEASMDENRFSLMTTTTMRGNNRKGFMEMLEEVSGIEESEEVN